jgi:hypothetical protein
MRAPIWLGLSGLARTGKSTLARYLADEHHFTVLTFADPIKWMAQRLMPHWSQYHIDGPGKEIPDPETGIVPRVLFQELGSAMRRVHPDFWLRQAEYRLGQLKGSPLARVTHLVWADVRYPNEAAWVRERGGRIIHLRRACAPVREHESEQGVEPLDGEVIIHNDGSRDALFLAADAVVTVQ